MGLSSVLDTNIVLYALRGELADSLPTDGVPISVITEIELLGFPGLTPLEEKAIRSLISSLEVVPLDDRVKDEVIRLKRATRIRLPDAVVLASAVVTQSELLTNDRNLMAMATVPCRSLRTTSTP
ncbi:MAG: type II toxin-antitoxin system VapC family toxin [Fimbriimonas sp.]